MKLFRRRRPSMALKLVGGLLSLGLLAAACGGGSSAGGGKTITIGYITWAEAIAATNVWEHILEERGYEVETKQLGAGALFKGLSTGDIDLFFDTWLPVTHKSYWKKFGGDLDKLTMWYDHASLELSVPKYSELNSIADLKGKASMYGGKITGIEPGAGETDVVKNTTIPKYGLDDYTLATSSTPAMLAALEKKTKAKEPIVVTLWRPHWAYAAYPIKDLKDPKGAMGGAEKIYAVAPKEFSDEFPDVAEWVGKFKMTDAQLGPLENAVVNKAEGDKARDKATAQWVSKNQELVNGWAGEPSS